METHAAVCEASNVHDAVLPVECRTPGPDVHIVDTSVLYIAAVREVQEVAYRSPVTGPYRWIVIKAQDWPHTSQNALLKLLEEPPIQTRVVLIVPSLTLLLPTVRSRLEVLDNQDISPLVVVPDAVQKWLQATVGDRLALIASLHKKSDSTELAIFLRDIISVIVPYRRQFSSTTQIVLAEVVDFSQRSGASRKYLLEALALSIPIVDTTKEVVH